MSEVTPSQSRFTPRHFRRPWYRALIPVAFATWAFGSFAYQIPGGTGFAIAGLGLTAAFAVALHGGLIVTRSGIEWYVVRPRWRYRRVPWEAVLNARPGPFGASVSVRLTVTDGRYEPWVWGVPDPAGRRDIVISTRGLVGGEGVWDAVREARHR